MKKLKLICIYALCCLSASAQSIPVEMKHFARDGLSFDYPAGWALNDKSTPQAQHLVIVLPNSSALIMVIAHRDTVTSSEQFFAARQGTTEPFIKSVEEKFRPNGKVPAERDFPCIEIGELKSVGGIRLRGSFNRAPSTGEFYSFVLGRRFVNLVYIRMDKDETQGSSAWDTIRRTLKIESPVSAGQAEAVTELEKPNVVSGGVINGKALSLPKPEYTSFARGARASGTVTVQVTIDEQGNVTTAQAVGGHPLLHAASIEAARGAKFSPTVLCGQPVKVTGIITYQFIYSGP